MRTRVYAGLATAYVETGLREHDSVRSSRSTMESRVFVDEEHVVARVEILAAMNDVFKPFS